jgi:hypothetical protein
MMKSRAFAESRIAQADPHYLKEGRPGGGTYPSHDLMLSSGFQHLRTDTDNEGETTHHYTHPIIDSHHFLVHSDRPGVSIALPGGAIIGREPSISSVFNRVRRFRRGRF